MSKGKTKAERVASHRAWEQRRAQQGNGNGHSPSARLVEVPYSAINIENVGEGSILDISRRTMHFGDVSGRVIAKISGNGPTEYFAAKVTQFKKYTRLDLEAKLPNYEVR